jgi:hypothetical protein
MSRIRGRLLPVLLAAAVLVAGANVAAYAATGGRFILGRDNRADRVSTLTNVGPGPALQLNTRPSAPPLGVSSGRKVTRLNADRVDGLDGRSLQSRAIRYRLPFVDSMKQFTISLPGLPEGVYLASYSLVATMATAGANVACHFDLVDQVPFAGVVGYGTALGSFSNANASGVVDTRQHPVTFSCHSNDSSFVVEGDESFTPYIVMTRIDGVSDGGEPVVRPAG